MEPPRHLLATLHQCPSHRLSEDEISLLWKFIVPRFEGRQPLRTNTGLPVSIDEPGEIGFREGPDVRDARILIEGDPRAGDVEIHSSPADWYRHGHHHDPAFNSVVLQVCMTGEKPPARREDGRFIETVCLGPMHDRSLGEIEQMFGEKRKQRLRSVKRPCFHSDPQVREEFHSTLAKTGEGWLYHQTSQLRARPHARRLWEGIIEALGYVRNHDPFRNLARSLDRQHFYRMVKTARRIHREAWLMGVAGWFDDLDEKTVNRTIRRRASLWHSRYSFESPSVERYHWNHSGVRPHAFPLRRWIYFGLATSRLKETWAEWCDRTIKPLLFQPSLRAPARRQFRSLFHGHRGYWASHYSRSDQPHDSIPLPVGTRWFDQWLVNVVLPWYYLRGLESGRSRLCDRVVYHLRQFPPVLSNRRTRRVLKQWGQSDQWQWNNVLEQQGAVFLYKYGCRKQQCDGCPFNRTGPKPDQPELFRRER